MKSIITLCLLIVATKGFSATWTLKVKYPDNEIKTYQFGDAATDITLGKFPWSCKAVEATSQTVSGLKMVSRQIDCYSGKVFASTLAACIQNDKGVPASSLLQIGNSKEYRSLILSCVVE